MVVIVHKINEKYKIRIISPIRQDVYSLKKYIKPRILRNFFLYLEKEIDFY